MAGMAPDPLSATRERLRRLEQLRAEGILTDEEYAAKRAAIVDDVIAVPVSNAPQPVGDNLLRLPGSGCPSCGRDVLSDRRFCQWCTAFLIQPSPGKMAGLFPRWVATWLDVLAPVALIILTLAATRNGAVVVLVVLGYAVWSLWAFGRGITIGKLLLGLRVVRTDGSRPGFLTMLLREWIGKPLDGLFFGVGWFWAIFDRDRQAWHDKIAGTVVVRIAANSARRMSASPLLPPSPNPAPEDATVEFPGSGLAKSYWRWASSRPRTWQRAAAFGAPALLAVYVIAVAAIATLHASTGGKSSTAAVPPSAAAQEAQAGSRPVTAQATAGDGVSMTMTVTGSTRAETPTGRASFYLCQPAIVAANGGDCSVGGDQVGTPKSLDASGRATSDVTHDTFSIGTYCWRSQYSGDAANPASTVADSSSKSCFITNAPSTPGSAELNIVQTAVDAKLANTNSATTAAITTATSDMTTAAGGFGLAPTYLRSTATHGTYTMDTTGKVSQAAYP